MHRLVAVPAILALAGGLSIAAPAVAQQTASFPEAGASATVPYPNTLAMAKRYVREQREATGTTSITVGLIDGDRVAWTILDGAGNPAGAKPKPQQAYGIGSVSKMFTTAAIMQLVDQGKVDLDKPVVDYMRDFRMDDPAYREITVRMLLNHSAGFPGSSYANGQTSRPVPTYGNQVLASLQTQRLKTTPGSMSVYCNDCFTVAGAVVAAVAGKPYTEYVEDNLLAPLEMTNSYFADQTVTPGMYAPVISDGVEEPYVYVNIYASGGLMSTAIDMGHFGSMLLNDGVYKGKRILSAASVREMGTNQLPGTLNPVNSTPVIYGLGWDTVRPGALDVVGVRGWAKSGGVDRYTTEFMLAPDQDLGVIVVGAADGGASPSAKIADVILQQALLEKGTIKRIPPQVTTTGPQRAKPPASVLSTLTGTYLAYDSAIKVTADSRGRLALEILADGEWTRNWGLGQSSYTYRTDGCFWSQKAAGVCVRAARGWGRHYLVLQVPSGSGNYLVRLARAQKVLVDRPLPEAWQQRLNEKWFFASGMPYELLWEDLPEMTLGEVPGLGGYLRLQPFETPFDASGSPDLGAMDLVIPGAFGRDLQDLVTQGVDGEDWLVYGNFLLRPKSTVKALAAGMTDVRFAGVAEWRQVSGAGALSLAGPLDAWYLYGPDLGAPLASGSGPASGVQVSVAGGYLVLMGAEGSIAQVTVN